MARKLANRNGFGQVDCVAAEFWGRHINENKWRVAFVQPSDSEYHGLEYWILFLDLDENQTSVEHGLDLPFPRSGGKYNQSSNYASPWPSRFEVRLDDAIQIAASAPSEGYFGPRELADIAGVCFEQAPMDPRGSMANQWRVVFRYESTDDITAGQLHAAVFLIDIHTGARHLLPIGYTAWCIAATE